MYRKMSKIAHYLQEHLIGEVSANAEVREHLATDSSVLSLTPLFAVYPKNEQDIRKTLRFSWQLAERGKVLPVTARGAGCDTSGSAIGSGAIIIMASHLNKILAFDAKKKLATIEAGISFDKLQQTLFTHDLCLPAYPKELDSTLGGGMANNVIGEKSIKYGDLHSYIQSLRVVLANGEVIETGPLSKKELSYKMGLSTFEGQIYRALDALLDDNSENIKKYSFASETRYNAIGYQLSKVKNKSSFDLTPLFLGSQGTLGIITEANIKLEDYNEETTRALISLPNYDDLESALPALINLGPSMLNFINRAALEQVRQTNPKLINGILPTDGADVHLLIEFDDKKEATRKQKIKNLTKIVDGCGGDLAGSTKFEDKQKMSKVFDSVAALFIPPQGVHVAVPIAEDIMVPPAKLSEFLRQAKNFFRECHLPDAIWGNAGVGMISVYPTLDLSQVSDRQKYFKLSEGLFNLATSLGGSITAAAGEGRVKAPYVRQLYGEELYNLTTATKAIFDPYGILNPGVKTMNINEVKALLRSSYSLTHRHYHRPRG